MRNNKENRGVALALAGALTLVGCTSAPSAPEVYSGSFSRSVMFPMIDARPDGGLDISRCNLNEPMTDFTVALSSLSQLEFAAKKGLTSPITRADLQQHNTEKLKQVPTAGSHYAIFLYLENFSRPFASFKFRVSTYVVRPDTGAVVWTNTNEDSVWQGVLLGPMDMLTRDVHFKGMPMNYCRALQEVTRDTFAKIPSLPAY